MQFLQDIISSFCSETEEEHKIHLSLMDYVKFDYGFMFKYSERPNTKAARKFEDDVPEEVKSKILRLLKNNVHIPWNIIYQE